MYVNVIMNCRDVANKTQALNPARDLGPRLFSAIIYGSEVFTTKSCYFLVPIFGPVVGCVVGAVTYDAMLFEGDGSRVADALDKAEGQGSLRLVD